MKGPHQRLKFDLRRLWECPACKRRERTTGGVTFRHCTCQMKQVDGKLVVMKLIADDVQRITPPIIIRHEQQADSIRRETTKNDIQQASTASACSASEPDQPTQFSPVSDPQTDNTARG